MDSQITDIKGKITKMPPTHDAQDVSMEKEFAVMLVGLKGRPHAAKEDISLLTERRKVLSARIENERLDLSHLNEELRILLEAISEKEALINEIAGVHEVIMNAAVALDTMSKSTPKSTKAVANPKGNSDGGKK